MAHSKFKAYMISELQWRVSTSWSLPFFFSFPKTLKNVKKFQPNNGHMETLKFFFWESGTKVSQRHSFEAGKKGELRNWVRGWEGDLGGNGTKGIILLICRLSLSHPPPTCSLSSIKILWDWQAPRSTVLSTYSLFHWHSEQFRILKVKQHILPCLLYTDSWSCVKVWHQKAKYHIFSHPHAKPYNNYRL